MSRRLRLRTLSFGAIPVISLAFVAIMDRVPGTDISLTVPYAAEGPGPTFNTLDKVNDTEVISIEGAHVDKTSGHLDMTTISVRTNMTFAQAVSRWIVHGDTLVPIERVIPQDKTEDEVREMNKNAFSSSESSATAAALHYLKKPMKVEVVGVAKDSPATKEIKIGDRIVAINGKDVGTGSQARDIVRSYRPGEKISIDVTRQGKNLNLQAVLAPHPESKDVPFLGINMTTTAQDDLKVTYNLEDIGGPSAGMMFALAVVDKLSPGELNHGKHVAGTGTIDDFGKVGPIGGIDHKAQAAQEAGAELFLAPVQNCAELKGTDFPSMKIAAVSSLSEAIAAMDDFAQGKELKSCG